MPLAERFPSRHNKSHSSKIQAKALNQHPNLRSIKITLDPSSSSQIRKIDNPLDDLTYDQIGDTLFFDEGLGTEYDTVEQNFGPSHLANNYNEQFPRLIHAQNSNDDPNNQIYDRDNLQNEPHPSMRADSQINDSLSNDSKFNKNDTQQIMTKAQIHNFPQNLQKPQQHTKIEMSTDNLKSQNRKFPLLPETQKFNKQHFLFT
jgi:hypothetical protein